MSANSSLFPPPAEWMGIVRRHWRLELAVAASIFAGATIFILQMPDIYRAETRILVNPQTVSNQYVNSAVSMNSTERLNTLSQQVLSSTRLQVIMDQLHLFPKLRNSMGEEQLINRMRNGIGIELKQSADGPSSFKLSYTGDSPTEVAEVTDRLAQSFIAWNLRDREKEAQGTTTFLSAELATTKSQLDGLEEQLRVYKLQHLGELPGQLDANMQALMRLQMQLQSNADAQNRLDHEAFLAKVDEPTVSSHVSGSSVPLSRQQLVNRSAEAHQELAELRKRYTSEFPDVVAKQDEVRDLDVRLASQAEKQPSSSPVSDTARIDLTPTSDPRLQLISRDRARLAVEQRRIEGAIAGYQERVNAAPIREQEISQLLRDYDTAKEHYRSLLEKTYSAQMAAALEREQQGGSFTMLDPARIPDLPIGPNRRALLLGALLGALCTALGAGLVSELFDSTIKSEASVRTILPGIPLLGLVPSMAITGAIFSGPKTTSIRIKS
jgi:succinoglycan biosynthesis transport protein ExoP